jgi:hypothetical protein
MFVHHLDTIGVSDRICLIIYSRGGDTLAAWNIANLVRLYCDHLTVLIPYKAHSAATLISLAADEIIMTKQATLGPIDPSINGPLNPQIPGAGPSSKAPVSVEAINGFFELIRSVGIDSSQEMASIVMELSKNIHPLVLGDIYRSRGQIRMLAKKLIANQVADEEKVDRILNFMCSDSGSHDYTINRREARQALALNVDKPSPKNYKIIKELYDDFAADLELTTPFNATTYLGADDIKAFVFKRGLIESLNGGSHCFTSEGILRKNQQAGHPQSTIDIITIREEWIHDIA